MIRQGHLMPYLLLARSIAIARSSICKVPAMHAYAATSTTEGIRTRTSQTYWSLCPSITIGLFRAVRAGPDHSRRHLKVDKRQASFLLSQLISLIKNATWSFACTLGMIPMLASKLHDAQRPIASSVSDGYRHADSTIN